MDCPVCQVDLVMSDRQGIEIDYCPKCRGVWLDRGELDKIIERSTTEQQRRMPTDDRDAPPHHEYQSKKRYGKHGHGKYGHGKYRRKSMLQELFDVFD